MIYLTGDTHGLHDFNKLKEFKFNKDDILIILGDCGLLFFNLDYMNEEMIKEYEKLDIEIIYIDGNHENFHHLNALDVVNHRGAKMHKVSDKIYHLLRGEIFEIEGKTFLGLGGARSIDKAYRTKDYDWWEEENITEEDLENALKNAKRYDNKVNYILTHCIDNNTAIQIFRYPPDNNGTLLSVLEYNVQYDKWYFGHYHVDKYCGNNKYCLYNSIIPLE